MTHAADVLTEGTALKQYCILAKANKGRACVALIEQALNNPAVYVFGELLDMPNIQALQQTEFKSSFDLLNIFAFGTYVDYIKNKDSLPALSPQMTNKLRQLTIVYLSTISKVIPYTLLQEQLGIANLRELEDLIIDSIYQNIIRGKLDQKNKHLEIEFAIGRDYIILTFDMFVHYNRMKTSDDLLGNITTLMTHTDKVHEKNRKERDELEKRIEIAKSQIKPENEFTQFDSAEYMDEFRSRKGAKTKVKDQLHKRP
ncbi:proteasome component region PCI domain-containing protein [Heterostelium album PN500]|uniref:Proteasome component region PCI domain-containing protein n=1 Tax=Heterostelium pallidum (strain ATCC 26659 / Pp 5 / PN500) TaxID=670386 RepID=D3BHU6_HETP5|nr:proteasome component region PCI domain-containing protein [Heterostelium album PN500]EFA78846.1 proteasome component region PCI domain-containing protein [Heterostelium album PN500]|eukprot:XP_020430970.1 proteasome component region PCI domain-containing protein [Heterostelium album PN500]